MQDQSWKDNAACLNYDTELFFDKYEENLELRPKIDSLCAGCPVRRKCFATGVSEKVIGVWGGVYFEDGKISKEFNSHRTKEDWGKTWQSLTME